MLLQRIDPHWEVMLAHLVLFDFIYPSERERVPRWLKDELIARLQAKLAAPADDEHICQGTLISRYQYLMDLRQWEYRDPRPMLPLDPAA